MAIMTWTTQKTTVIATPGRDQKVALIIIAMVMVMMTTVRMKMMRNNDGDSHQCSPQGLEASFSHTNCHGRYVEVAREAFPL